MKNIITIYSNKQLDYTNYTMQLDRAVDTYNYQYANINQPANNNVLLQNCNEMLTPNSSYLDNVFNQVSPYNFPPMIICEDSKRTSVNNNILLFNLDIIKDNCGNTFNLRNQINAAGLQAGYARNIDVESELHRINYYADRCYYDNYKVNPKDPAILQSNGLRCYADVFVKDYTPVGKIGKTTDCIGICKPPVPCNNTPPTDINCETDVRKRYDFSTNKLQGPTCIAAKDWRFFPKVAAPSAKDLSFQSKPRNQQLICALNSNEVKHDYYHFGDDSGRCKNPAQRLFNNVTRRSMLPNFHNLTDIGPEYLA